MGDFPKDVLRREIARIRGSSLERVRHLEQSFAVHPNVLQEYERFRGSFAKEAAEIAEVLKEFSGVEVEASGSMLLCRLKGREVGRLDNERIGIHVVVRIRFELDSLSSAQIMRLSLPPDIDISQCGTAGHADLGRSGWSVDSIQDTFWNFCNTLALVIGSQLR